MMATSCSKWAWPTSCTRAPMRRWTLSGLAMSEATSSACAASLPAAAPSSQSKVMSNRAELLLQGHRLAHQLFGAGVVIAHRQRNRLLGTWNKTWEGCIAAMGLG
jgi:hypothetical protein